MRSVFVSTGAFLGRIDGETRCAFWSDEPIDHDFDAARLIEIDLARTPSAAAAGRIPWDAIQVDDCYPGPTGEVIGTTLGPCWPEMQLTGIVCLEEGFRSSLPEALRPACPPDGMEARAYEFTSVVYWPHTSDPRAGRRYAGHHARIVQEQGTVARVAVYPPGTSEHPDAQPVLMWVDLSAVDQCDVGPSSLTEIGTGDGEKEGALFLLSGQVQVPPSANSARR